MAIDVELFYKENSERQINTLRKYLHCSKETAEDIVQEAYLSAIKYLDSYEEDKSTFNTWMNSIIFNIVRKLKKKEKKERSYLINPQEELNTQRYEDLFKEIQAVKNKVHREILSLFYLAGYSSREISSILEKVSQTNVTTICNRFRERLVNNNGDYL